MQNDKGGIFLCVACAIAAIVFVLTSNDTYYVQVVIWISINALLAAALRFVLLIGELNIATAAFFGIGAYAAAVASTLFEMPLVLSLLIAPIVAAVLSVVFGWITLRTKGPYFLLISFAFTEVVRLIYTKTDLVGGNSGIVGIYGPIELDPWFPAIVVSLLMATLFGLYAIERSSLGKLFKAIQNNEDIPRSVGINVMAIKVLCVAIAAAALGLGGGLHAFTNHVITPGDFTFFVAVLALTYVKIGGEEHIVGAVLGAVLMTLVAQWLLGFGIGENIFYGATIIFAMLLMPKGLIGVVDQVRRLAPTAGARRRGKEAV
ncbi:MAG: branched-chain amino acid ABC transporter permease [Burkholderiaceae bacterium]